MKNQAKEVANKVATETVVAPNMTKYVYMKQSQKLLDIGFATNTNVIQFGPGGHGKSEYSIDYLATKGVHNPFVITMGKGMTTDRLFGGMDIPVFEATGKIEYLVENSWMNHEYVIFEELFDAPDYILEQLKDIISSGQFRNGGQRFKVKTKFIICNTNIPREDFVKNASLAALMERFPLETEVKWKTYSEATYSNLLNKTVGAADPLLCYLLDSFAKANVIISPRIAIKAGQLMASHGVDALEFLAEFQTKKSLLKTSIEQFKAAHKMRSKAGELQVLVAELEAVDLASLTLGEVAEYKTKIEVLKQKVDEVNKLKVSEADTSIKTQVVKKVKNYIDASQKTLALAGAIAL